MRALREEKRFRHPGDRTHEPELRFSSLFVEATDSRYELEYLVWEGETQMLACGARIGVAAYAS